jgi:hypothetical protein
MLSDRVDALCMLPQPPYAESFRNDDVLLTGRVLAVQKLDEFGKMLAAIRVWRIWKGDVSTNLTVYVRGGTDDYPDLREGEDYFLVLSKKPDPSEDNFAPPGSLFAFACSAASPTADYVRAWLKELGPGRPAR